MEFLEELKWRGLFKDCTDEASLTQRLQQPITCYCGFDPTADSLHIGHLQQIMLLKRYQEAGHKPIALCGGATGMIGDPRPTTERRLISLDEVGHNVACIKEQLSKFIDFSEGKGALMNNYDWLGTANLLEFLRDYGKHFNVSYMLAKDTIAKRLDTGISFTEFTYTILQAVDFLTLYEKENCQLQIGGSDQWGNLTSGTDLIRKVHGDKASVWGVTSPLITKSDGTKFGKSEGGNVWLDPAKTSAYEFYQFWINVADTDIIDFLKRLSMKTPEEIMSLEESLKTEAHLRKAQKALAEELTLAVHGEEGLATAVRITDTLFKGDIRDLTPNEIKEGLKDVPWSVIEEGLPLVDVLVNAHIASSKREAREWIQGNSIAVNGVKVTDNEFKVYSKDGFDGEFTIIKKGKKSWYVLHFGEE